MLDEEQEDLMDGQGTGAIRKSGDLGEPLRSDPDEPNRPENGNSSTGNDGGEQGRAEEGKNGNDSDNGMGAERQLVAVRRRGGDMSGDAGRMTG
jgi:hypothetical protein